MATTTNMFLLSLSVLHMFAVHAQQSGTMEQDITSIPAYSQQKNCATSCFQYSGAFCFNDFLGNAIGCAQTNLCESKGWLARNDCYCSPGKIQTAQDYLEACISSKCSVGDVSVDVAMATSLYVGYCAQKGYTAAAAPANVPATTTPAASGFSTSPRTAAGSGPTGSGTADSTSDNAPSSSKSLSTGTIIGIVVGALAGLAFLAAAIWIFWKLFASCANGNPYNQQHGPSQIQQTPVYPKMSDQQPWYPSPGPGSDIGPGDSVSMVGGMARPAPTLLSDARY